MDEAIRYLAATFSDKGQILFLNTLLNKIAINSKSFKEMIVDIVSNDTENVMRYVNTCTLCNYIVEMEEKFSVEWKILIGRLIVIVKDKIDLVRRAAAILLAKMCQNEKNLEVARSLHGTEVLMQLQSYLV